MTGVAMVLDQCIAMAATLCTSRSLATTIMALVSNVRMTITAR